MIPYSRLISTFKNHENAMVSSQIAKGSKFIGYDVYVTGKTVSHQRKMEQRSLTSQSRAIQLLEVGVGLKCRRQ